MMALAGMAAVVVAAVIVPVTLIRNRGTPEGPVYAGGGRDISAAPADTGVPYSFGYLLKNESTHPAVLERVRLVGVTGPLEVLGLMARPHPSPPARGTFFMLPGYPPADFPAVPFADLHVVPVAKTHSEGGEPNEGLMLIFGVQVNAPGATGARGIDYTYRIGKRRYRNVYEGSDYLCGPRAEYVSRGPGQCPGSEIENRFEKKFVEFRPTGRVTGASS